MTSTNQQGSSVQEQVQETASQDNTDIVPKTPSSKSSTVGASAPATPTGSHVTGTLNTTSHVLPGASTASTIILGASPTRGMLESVTVVSSAPVSVSIPTKEEEVASSPGRKSPALSETGLRGVGRGNLASVLSSSNALSSVGTVPSNGAFGVLAPSASEITKRSILGTDEKFSSTGIAQPLVSPLSNRMMVPQAARANDMMENGNVGETAGMSGRVFSPSVVPGMQWRPGSSFQNQNEAVCPSNFRFFSTSFYNCFERESATCINCKKNLFVIEFFGPLKPHFCGSSALSYC